MKRKKIVYCGLTIVFVLMAGCLALLMPIGKIGDRSIRMYRFLNVAMQNKTEILEEMAEGKAFDELCEQLQITVREDEIKREVETLKTQFPNLNQTEIVNVCRNSILRQKAIEKLAEEVNVTADFARMYYENNIGKYEGEEPDFGKIKFDIQMEMGEKKYEETLEKIRSSYGVMP